MAFDDQKGFLNSQRGREVWHSMNSKDQQPMNPRHPGKVASISLGGRMGAVDFA